MFGHVLGDQDVMPRGYLRLHHALHEMIGLLNLSDGCEQASGMPLSYNYDLLSEQQRLEEWGGRVRRRARAEAIIWRAIAGDGDPRRITVYTRRNMHVELQRIDTDAFYRSGFRRNHSLSCGLYLTYEYVNGTPYCLNELPLLVSEGDWIDFKTILQKDVLKFGDPTSAAEKECVTWLSNMFASDPDRKMRKAQFWEAATTTFGSRLSKNSFNRAWQSVAKAAGRDGPGAPRKTHR